MIVFLILLLTILISFRQSEASTNELSISYKEAVQIYASEQDIPHEWLYKTIEGESNFNPKAIHDGGKGKGIAGYHKSTFEYHKKLFNQPNLVYDNQLDQIRLMAIALKNDRGYEWTVFCKNFGEKGKNCNWYFKRLAQL